ncbi:MAG: sugar phosphate nucleotidyltransferase [Candidatus Cloacimonadota bacterium]|nr:sugar phosphate nucleotidyltransferase [Candidatus Cloacimonadota bacterium]
MKAIIIAAGCGSRLKKKHKGMPKTLLKINGKRIIDDIIAKIKSSGIKDIIIITGYKNKMLENALTNYNNSELNPVGCISNGINIQFGFNADWEKANGISVSCAKNFLQSDDQFILLMSDHIFDRKILENIIATELANDEALLGLDFKIDSIPDLDDGMKIQCTKRDGKIYQIHKFDKKLEKFQAIDTGIFKFNYSFFSVLEESFQNGNYSLSDACNILARKNRMSGFDIGEYIWLDVDTPEMIEQDKIIRQIF